MTNASVTRLRPRSKTNWWEELLTPLKDPPGSYAGKVSTDVELANKCLAINTANTRPLIEAAIMGLMRQMQTGDFVYNPYEAVGIRYFPNGVALLDDGQHRMHALVRCGIPQDFHYMVVPHDLEVTRCNGTGLGRTLSQRISYLGGPGSLGAQVARLIWVHLTSGGKKSRSTPKLVLPDGERTYLEYAEGIKFVADLLVTHPSAWCKNAGYRTALTRAYYNFDSIRVAEFHRQFVTGVCAKKIDNASQALYKAYAELKGFHQTSKPNIKKANVDFDTHHYYLLCESAVAAFCKCESVTQLKPATYAGECFPLTPTAPKPRMTRKKRGKK